MLFSTGYCWLWTSTILFLASNWFILAADEFDLLTSRQYQTKRVVVSLSSFIGRLRPLNDTIQSLLPQITDKFDGIYIHIPMNISRIAMN